MTRRLLELLLVPLYAGVLFFSGWSILWALTGHHAESKVDLLGWAALLLLATCAAVQLYLSGFRVGGRRPVTIAEGTATHMVAPHRRDCSDGG